MRLAPFPHSLALVTLAACLAFSGISTAKADPQAKAPTAGADERYEPRGAGDAAAERAAGIRRCRGTYAGAPRRADGHVDAERLLEQLADLGVDTYNWLVWRSASDWEDLRAFLPLARARGVRVWVTLVPPSESPPHADAFSEPFRLDYERWADEIAKLSLAEPNLVAWSIDDFTHNLRVFTPDRTRALVRRSRAINPRLAFVPCAYFKSITPRFAAAYKDTVDGVLFPYRNESRGANLTDAEAVTDEVRRLRELLGPDVRVIVDVYSSRHSTLGSSTPEYVRRVLIDASTAADGVIVYCHPGGAGEREKYEVTREVFRAAREARGNAD